MDRSLALPKVRARVLLHRFQTAWREAELLKLDQVLAAPELQVGEVPHGAPSSGPQRVPCPHVPRVCSSLSPIPSSAAVGGLVLPAAPLAWPEGPELTLLVSQPDALTWAGHVNQLHSGHSLRRLCLKCHLCFSTHP